MRRIWSPRCCPSCGGELERWKDALGPDVYVPCLPCGRLFITTDDGVESVLLSLEPVELRRVFDELVQAWFSLERRRRSNPQQVAA